MKFRSVALLAALLLVPLSSGAETFPPGVYRRIELALPQSGAGSWRISNVDW